MSTLELAGRLVTNPGSWVAWIIVGLIAGAVAARVVTGRGFGCIADIIVGIVGALIGEPVSVDSGTMAAAAIKRTSATTNHHGCSRDSRAGRRIGTPDRLVGGVRRRIDERLPPDHGAPRTRER